MPDEAVLRNEDVLKDLGIITRHLHSRYRVYPQDVRVTVTLAAAAVANTFGGWVETIPLNTVPFVYEVAGIVIEGADAVTTYFVQLGYNIILADPGTNMEMGERRFKLTDVPITRATELLHFRCQEIPANSRLMGRLKTASGAADECEISVVLIRHVDIHREQPLYPAFPW